MTYETPDWIQAVQDAAIVLAFITALIAAIAAVGRYLIVRPLERYIDERTPRNGGKSLSDLHAKVDVLSERVIRIEGEITRLDDELDAL